ncbi:helix-turn-helix domain-containing protein [Micromonospora sp. NPDC047670]|uniref:helix-turn-helix domain-containing protein n=1 Tax=Micromonospora sp. NPDC047670 TaxID=3364252 RepID=UPI00371E8E01
MSIEAVAWALNHAPDVPPQCLAVLIGLANHAHANGRAAYPTQDRLAHYARKSVRSVQRDLDELARRGLIRRGDQRHTAFLPADRRPVVWDLAMERRRPLPDALDPLAEPQSGRPTEVPEPVDNRGDAHDAPVPDRGDVHVRTGRRTRPDGATYTSHKPSLTVQNQTRARTRTRAFHGTAPPINPIAHCPRHRGSPAGNCGPCRSEILAGGS